MEREPLKLTMATTFLYPTDAGIVEMLYGFLHGRGIVLGEMIPQIKNLFQIHSARSVFALVKSVGQTSVSLADAFRVIFIFISNQMALSLVLKI